MMNETRTRIYNYLVNYVKENLISPSILEISQASKVSVYMVQCILKELEKENVIRRERGKPRSICLQGYKLVKYISPSNRVSRGGMGT